MKAAILERFAASALLAAGSALCLLALPAHAQSYTVLHPFFSEQQSPRGLIQATDGNFYGVTTQGGANGFGSVLRISPAGTPTTLYSFSGSDGANPYASPAQGTDGNFYGTTTSGGASGKGTVFRITPAGELTTLCSFSGPDGESPYGAVVQGVDGTFYGTTYLGGAGGYGTVFRITSAGVFRTLHSFGPSTGAYPYAGLVLGTDGDFYGTTFSGTIFKITPDGALTTLHFFDYGWEGDYPYAGLVQGTDGSFYGTTSTNGFAGYGGIFKITPTGALTLLYSFGGSPSQYPSAQYPFAGLVQGSDGNFYGTTTRDEGSVSTVLGTVFRMTPAGALTTLHSFTGSDGAFLEAGLVQGIDGSLYGTTLRGGATGAGSFFRITPAGTLTTLHSFVAHDGASPECGLVQGVDGNVYGTTPFGGASGLGTVFGITSAGFLTMGYSFPGIDGASPSSGLVQGTDRSLYGTTPYGGASGFGTVFKITPGGALTTLRSFSGSDGALPYAGLASGTDGTFYGTTSHGGASNVGTVFKITPAGELTTLHSFGGNDGWYPYAGLVHGSDGNFYGTTYYGGSGRGTVFKITPAGEITTLHSFGGSDGWYPYAALVQGTDGSFYGTASEGGVLRGGTVFKITPEGTFTTLHSFSGLDGQSPYSPLLRGRDGNFYGMTSSGGANYYYGTVFKITPTGTLTTLHSFAGSDGATPYAGLVQGTDGDLYGTASAGGPRGGGVVFRLTLGPGPSPTVTGVSPSSGPVLGGTVATVSGTDFQPGATVSFGDAAATGVTYVSATTLFATAPPHAVGAVTVTVTNPDLQAGGLPSAYTYTCSGAPTAFNGGPYCTGATISLSTPTVSGATYFWNGPNGFTSTLQNPTIVGATAANAGTYRVTVTVAGCTSAPGTTNVVVPTPAIPVITAPASTVGGTTGMTASVVPHAGSTWSWTIQNGTITAGQGSSQITFTAGVGGTLTLSVTETSTLGCVSAPGNATVTVAPAAATFYLMTPCRIVDTRNPNGPPGGPSIAAQSIRSFVLTGTTCSLPQTASGVSMSVTVADATSDGSLTMYPGTGAAPGTNTLSFNASRNRANNVILGLTGGVLSVQNNQASGTVELIIDVNGYFQ